MDKSTVHENDLVNLTAALPGCGLDRGPGFVQGLRRGRPTDGPRDGPDFVQGHWWGSQTTCSLQRTEKTSVKVCQLASLTIDQPCFNFTASNSSLSAPCLRSLATTW